MNTIYRIALITALATSGAAINSRGAEIMTLAECIDSAASHNPALQIASGAVEKARILKGTAFDPEQTSLTLKQETTGGGGPENGITVSQDFEFPTVYVARHKALKAEEELERRNYAVALNETVRDVTSAYYTLLYFREMVSLRLRQDSLYTRFEHIASVRFDNGDCSPLEPMNARRLLNANNVALAEARNNCEEARRKLMFLIGAEYQVEPADNSLSVINSIQTENGDYNFDSTPRGEAAASEIELSERNLAVTRHEFLPGISVGATAQALIKSFNPYNVDRSRFEKGDFMGFEVGITVPLFFGAQRARARAAKKDLEIAQLKSELLRQEAENEYSDAMGRMHAARKNLEYYNGTGKEEAAEIARIADVSYALGDIDYVEYMANLETAYEMLAGRAEAINTYNQTIITLNYLTGKQ